MLQCFRVEYRRKFTDGSRDKVPLPGAPVTEETKPQALVLVGSELDDAYEAIGKTGLVIDTQTDDGRTVEDVEIVNIGTLNMGAPVFLAVA